MSEADFLTLLSKLDRLVDTMALKHAPDMWSAKQIATWMGLSESTVTAKVICRGGFPKPVIPTGSIEAQSDGFPMKSFNGLGLIEASYLIAGALDANGASAHQSKRAAISEAVAL